MLDDRQPGTFRDQLSHRSSSQARYGPFRRSPPVAAAVPVRLPQTLPDPVYGFFPILRHANINQRASTPTPSPTNPWAARTSQAVLLTRSPTRIIEYRRAAGRGEGTQNTVSTETYPELDADERTTLTQFLDQYRRRALSSLEQLTDAQARTKPLPATDLTPGGIVKHLAHMEDHWFMGPRGGITAPRNDETPGRREWPLTWGFGWSRLSESNRRPSHYE
ncbi:DUF664 domain-containing protein [Kribbella ginsengisoli]|uniref:mycothiol transferase n=1 Tax=Kribbella ginsengisoli TaxID=363865 RepID=UPI003CD0565B